LTEKVNLGLLGKVRPVLFIKLVAGTVVDVPGMVVLVKHPGWLV
jgi:hypothetical protein